MLCTPRPKHSRLTYKEIRADLSTEFVTTKLWRPWSHELTKSPKDEDHVLHLDPLLTLEISNIIYVNHRSSTNPFKLYHQGVSDLQSSCCLHLITNPTEPQTKQLFLSIIPVSLIGIKWFVIIPTYITGYYNSPIKQPGALFSLLKLGILKKPP